MNTVKAGQGSGAIGSASSDDESLVDALMRLHPRIYARALFLTQERHAADDLVQQVCERALRAQASFRPGTDAAAWLYRVMRNLFIDDRRSRRTTVEMREEPAASTAEQPGPCDVLTLADIRQAMTTLRPRDREILELAYFQRFSYREISQRLGLNERTTGTRIFRARAKLKQPLGVAYERLVADLRGDVAVPLRTGTPTALPTAVTSPAPASDQTARRLPVAPGSPLPEGRAPRRSLGGRDVRRSC